MKPGSRVLLTGAAGGIGRALVERLVAGGARVLATDLAEAGEAPPGGAYRRLDVGSAADWEAALADAQERWGGLDVLLNVAGVARVAPFRETTPADTRRQCEVNYLGAALGMHVVGEAMAAAGAGHIVNLTSIAGAVPVPSIAAYSASKAALRALSLAVDAELAGSGVRVSVVGPDLTDTPMYRDQFADPGGAGAFAGGWLLAPEEVARVVCVEVLRDKPAERLIPWSRGAFGRVMSALPWLYRRLVPGLWRRRLAAAAAAGEGPWEGPGRD